MKEILLNEEDLVKRCLKNDRHAQEFLFKQFYSELYVISMRYLSDHHEAEDTLIKTYTKVFKNLNKFSWQGPGSLGRWIRTILINESVRALKKRRAIFFDEDLTYLNNQFDEESGLQKLQAEDIHRLIERLPSGYRTVFNLYVVEGYTHKEIAKMLEISESTSKTQLKKARTRLMLQIKEEKSYGNF